MSSTEAPRLWRLHKEYFSLGKPPLRGEIYSVTRDSTKPRYSGWIAYIRLDNGKIRVSQLTDIGTRKPEIGDRVEPVLKKLGEEGERGPIVYGYKYRLEYELGL